MTERQWDDVRLDEPTSEIEVPAEQPEEPQTFSPKRKGGFAVLAVQSSVCVILLGAAFLMRMIGGDTGQRWSAQIREALLDNRIVEWVFGEWHGGESDVSEEPPKPPAAAPTDQPPKSDASGDGVELSFPSDQAAASAVYLQTAAVIEPAEQTAVFRRQLPLPNCLPLLTGVLTSGYGEREHPISGEDSFHTGWDIAAEEGTPLAAMYDATVTETGSGGSYGNYVEMRVNERLSFLYAHCLQLLVSEGDVVSAGQTVARVGSTGVSTGNHVHVEILVDGEVCDPSMVLTESVYPSG